MANVIIGYRPIILKCTVIMTDQAIRNTWCVGNTYGRASGFELQVGTLLPRTVPWKYCNVGTMQEICARKLTIDNLREEKDYLHVKQALDSQ